MKELLSFFTEFIADMGLGSCTDSILYWKLSGLSAVPHNPHAVSWAKFTTAFWNYLLNQFFAKSCFPEAVTSLVRRLPLSHHNTTWNLLWIINLLLALWAPCLAPASALSGPSDSAVYKLILCVNKFFVAPTPCLCSCVIHLEDVQLATCNALMFFQPYFPSCSHPLDVFDGTSLAAFCCLVLCPLTSACLEKATTTHSQGELC